MHIRRGRIGRALAGSLLVVASGACASSKGGQVAEAPAPARRVTGDTASGAYGTSQRGRGASARVSRITREDIDRARTSDLAGFIEARLSGVRVIANRGEYTVLISGASFQSNPAALVLVDGTEGSLAGLTLQNIEAIEVVKDSAAGIYGVRGANGVLVITTRKR